ncbi:MAG: alpha/beta fold hydrolase [Archangiaceae bacterium]|nr:alpha/beta fold hydrolase [Archangiaceae bacterium]
MTNRFLLLHGSWHGAWCWFKVAPRLRAHGEVVVPNLPGRGTKTPFVTLKTMLQAVEPLLRDEHPTTIVAHSRYGILATALAEARPAAVKRVVYLASFMLRSGERVADFFPKDEGSLLRQHVKVNRLSVTDSLRPQIWREGLYADCSEDDVALASSLLCAEPSWPALTRVRTTPARFGTVPRAYLRLTQDRAVSPAMQDRLIEALPPQRVESIEASHSAYFSKPDALVRAILSVSGA